MSPKMTHSTELSDCFAMALLVLAPVTILYKSAYRCFIFRRPFFFFFFFFFVFFSSFLFLTFTSSPSSNHDGVVRLLPVKKHFYIFNSSTLNCSHSHK